MMILHYKLTWNVEKIVQKCAKDPMDCQLSIEKCFLEVHNFIQLNSTAMIGENVSSKAVNLVTDKSFKTYISSYTKPYLIELIQNSTKNCICCE